MSEIREKFATDLADVCWKDLRIHMQRDAIITVAGELDLIDVAVAVARDEKELVGPWIEDAQLSKPSREQLDAWETQLDKGFRVLIVQPFILIQEIIHA